jgi:hypothetical protein
VPGAGHEHHRADDDRAFHDRAALDHHGFIHHDDGAAHDDTAVHVESADDRLAADLEHDTLTKVDRVGIE